MVLKGSYLKVIDNSGAKWAKCIKIVGKSVKGGTGNWILITLSNFTNRKKVKKRTIYLGLIVGVKYWTFRADGSFFKFFVNKVLLFNRQYKFLGTRVYGCLSKDLKIKFKLHSEKIRFYKLFARASLIL